MPLDPSRDAVPAPCKGVSPLTLSRDWVGDVCMLRPHAAPPCVRVSLPPAAMLGRGGFSLPQNDKKTPLTLANQGLIGIRQRLILPGRVQPSTFSTGELNCCVRDGNRWNLSVIATGNGSYLVASTFSFLPFRKRSVKVERGETPLHPDNCTSNDSSDRSN